MSKISIAILFAAIGLVTLGSYLNVPFATGVSGLILVVALIYSFIVAKREMERVAATIQEQERARVQQPKKPAPMPKQAAEA
ncbi:MAG: hypothetical protein AAF697_07225 [Pseudomonadota bacterium]